MPRQLLGARMPRKMKRPPRSGGTEYRFVIDAYTPDTIPMARLAEYMQQLSQLLGETAAVHFKRLEKGSTALVHRIEREAVPKVRERVSSVRRGDAPKEAVRAYKTINKFLRDDNATGELREKKHGSVVVRFPGREEAEEKFPSVRQQGFVDGQIIRVGGFDETVPVWLETEGKQISGCYTTRSVAKQLAIKLFEQVRLFGRGRWSRDSEGTWSLLEFKIESFEPLDDAPLSGAIVALRTIPTEWSDNSAKELNIIRHGPGVKGNGGH
jgi:hypothetical protein